MGITNNFHQLEQIFGGKQKNIENRIEINPKITKVAIHF
jgi:hypothetical protein